MLLFLCFSGGCNKDLADVTPSIFNFKVVDYYSGLPVPNAYAILRCDEGWANYYYDEVIGQTDVNGEFQYTYNVIDNRPEDTILKYYILFTNQNYSNPSVSPNFPDKTHVYKSQTTAAIDVKIFQCSTINLTTKRISQNPLNLGMSYCGFCVKSSDKPDSNHVNLHKHYNEGNVNDVHSETFYVPSEMTQIIFSKVCWMCTTFQDNDWDGTGFSRDSLHLGYHESRNYYIEY
ncbi:MAG: hypothetical protein WCM76_09585 [Bacteroidota bacterium]